MRSTTIYDEDRPATRSPTSHAILTATLRNDLPELRAAVERLRASADRQ
jgi:hypothetical protein